MLIFTVTYTATTLLSPRQEDSHPQSFTISLSTLWTIFCFICLFHLFGRIMRSRNFYLSHTQFTKRPGNLFKAWKKESRGIGLLPSWESGLWNEKKNVVGYRVTSQLRITVIKKDKKESLVRYRVTSRLSITDINEGRIKSEMFPTDRILGN